MRICAPHMGSHFRFLFRPGWCSVRNGLPGVENAPRHSQKGCPTPKKDTRHAPCASSTGDDLPISTGPWLKGGSWPLGMAAASKLAFAPQVAVLCTVFLATWQLLRRKRATCPAVPGVLVLGNLPELLKAALSNRHLEMFVRHHRQLGQTIVYSLPLKPEIVVTTNPRNVEHMLKGNFENFVKGWWSRVPLTQLLGDG
ncbi:unnamed protein product, partial [Effrenium voratum]